MPFTTVGDYVRWARAAGLSWPLPDGLDDEALEARCLLSGPSPSPRPVPPDWEQLHVELRRPGVTLMLLWLEFRYKHSRVKQYLKEGRALRIETVINTPWGIGIRARLEHLPELVAKGRQVNARLLMIERASQGCAIGSALFERIHQPYIREGQRTTSARRALTLSLSP